MKFSVTYVMVTRVTCKRAGSAQTEVVDTRSNEFAAVHGYDEAYYPRAVMQIFEERYSTDHSQCKVIDVRPFVHPLKDITDEERNTYKKQAALIADVVDAECQRTGVNLKLAVSDRLMKGSGGLTESLRVKWLGIPAKERMKILDEVL